MQIKYIIIFLLITFVSDVYACDCPQKNIEDDIENYDIIFIGEVLEDRELSTDDGNCLDRFLGSEKLCSYPIIINEKLFVSKSFLRTDSILPVAYYNGNTCDYFFSVGKEYLIFANASLDGTFLSIDYCSRTREVSKAQDDLIFIKNYSFLDSSYKGAKAALNVNHDDVDENFIMCSNMILLVILTIFVLVIFILGFIVLLDRIRRV